MYISQTPISVVCLFQKCCDCPMFCFDFTFLLGENAFIIIIFFMYTFQIPAHTDPFLRSIAHWVLEDYSKALDTLIEQPSNCKSSASPDNKCDTGTLFLFSS